MPRVAIVLVCAGLVLASTVQAQQAEPRDPSVGGSPDIPLTPARFNAAMQYHTAWMLLETVLELEDLTDDELTAVASGGLPEGYIRMLEGNQYAIEYLLPVTKLKVCDFGINYEKGVNAIVPQLSVMRQTARMLCSDAKRLEETDMDAAVERYAAAIRVGEHVSQTGLMIGSLTGIAITNMVTKEIQRLLDENMLTSGQAELLALALDRVLTDDPFHSLRAIESDSMATTAWIKHEFQGDDAGMKFVESIGLGAGFNEEIIDIEGEELAKMVDQMAAGYGEFIRAWQTDDAAARIVDIEHRLESGEFGPVAFILMPAIGQYHKSRAESVEELTELRSQLRAISKEEKEKDTN